MRKVFIDIQPIAIKFHNEWDGISHGGSGKRFLNSKKKDMIAIVKDRIDRLELTNEITKYEININDRNIILHFETENTGIDFNVWSDNMKKDVTKMYDYFWGKGINCFSV